MGTIIATITSTIISTLTSIGVALYLANRNDLRRFDEKLEELLKTAIQYPYLENAEFASDWTSKYDRTDERKLRYEVYCTLVFNYLSDLCKHFKYNQEKVENYIAFKSWVRPHKKYWRDPSVPHENVDTYSRQFVSLVENAII